MVPRPRSLDNRGNMSIQQPTSMVVGVTPHQPERVVREALSLARGCGLSTIHFVFSNPTLVHLEGAVEPLDPDTLNDSWGQETSDLGDRVMSMAHDEGILADFTCLAGNPAKGLARFAHETNARLIVVGTRERGTLAAVEEWAHGSVAVRLAHIQDIPILVVPLAAENASDSAGKAAGVDR